MKSLLELLPSIVAEGKREAERVMERAESSYRLGLQTRELVVPSKDTSWKELSLNSGALERSSQESYNSLIYGSNVLAIAALLAGANNNVSIRGSVDLIYIDPPFDSKTDYQTRINILGGAY